MTTTFTPTMTAAPVGALHRLTSRDLAVLELLAEHEVMSTRQIAAVFFPTVRAAQNRLAILHRLDVVSRHAWGHPSGGHAEYLYSLGPLRALVRPHAAGRIDPAVVAPAHHDEWMWQLIGSPRLRPTLAANGLFTALIAHSRTHPATRLARWWSGPRAAATFAQYRIRPHGHGVWQAHGRTVGFFLEGDTGDDQSLLARIAGYRHLSVTGPRYPVLLRTADPDRRDQVRALLTGEPGPTVAVAAAEDDPARRTWYLPGRRFLMRERRPCALHELASDHGPDTAVNPGRYPPSAGFP
ncbi:replication-relaxation family protein [Longispora sp. K20-0274]|uniref:replication-relaxation family protein n=1 Tax=Longispora sp. K20-0274 TaxID=3088255 RepID=UPI00399BB448